MKHAPEPSAADAADAADLLSKLEHELEDGQLIKELAKSTTKQVLSLRCHGFPVSKRTAEELVHDALLDTIEGRRPWRGDLSLREHLRRAIRDNVSVLTKRRKRFFHVPLDRKLMMDETNDDEKHSADIARQGLRADERPGRALSVGDAAQRMLSAVRAAAPTDEAVLRSLAAWESGYTQRADAISVSGLSPAEYDAAWMRIRRIVKKVPTELRDAAHDAMEVTHGDR